MDLLHYSRAFSFCLLQLIDPLHDDVRMQNTPGAHCTMGLGLNISDIIYDPFIHVRYEIRDNDVSVSPMA